MSETTQNDFVPQTPAPCQRISDEPATIFACAQQRRFPSRREMRATSIGSDELIALAEWRFRSRPRKLKNLRTKHVKYCVSILREIERAA
jgi:hypothetical protein